MSRYPSRTLSPLLFGGFLIKVEYQEKMGTRIIKGLLGNLDVTLGPEGPFQKAAVQSFFPGGGFSGLPSLGDSNRLEAYSRP